MERCPTPTRSVSRPALITTTPSHPAASPAPAVAAPRALHSPCEVPLQPTNAVGVMLAATSRLPGCRATLATCGRATRGRDFQGVAQPLQPLRGLYARRRASPARGAVHARHCSQSRLPGCRATLATCTGQSRLPGCRATLATCRCCEQAVLVATSRVSRSPCNTAKCSRSRFQNELSRLPGCRAALATCF